MQLDREGRSPLHYAALDGDAEEARRLLDAGADPSLPDRAGFTPLHFAAQQGQAESIRTLVAAGAVIDAQDRWGNTPLWRAVYNSAGKRDCVALLLDAGADADLENASAVSPRILADRMDATDLMRSR